MEMRAKIIILNFCIGLTLVFGNINAWALNPAEVAKLIASDGTTLNGYFGTPVAVDSDTAVIGARGDDDNGTDSGSAYVFIRTGAGWTQQAKLNANDGAQFDWFGNSLKVQDDTILVGARNNDLWGSVYVFVRSGTNWSQQAKLKAGDGAVDDWFGSSVALDGGTAVIGAWGDDVVPELSGSAYVFVRSGSTWSEQAKLIPSDPTAYDYFGSSVAIHGDTVLVTTVAMGTLLSEAYVFVRNGVSWNKQAKLISSDLEKTSSLPMPRYREIQP